MTAARFRHVAVLGGGAWGTALAQLLADDSAGGGSTVTIWARDPQTARSIRDGHAHPGALPGLALSSAVGAESRLDRAVAGCDLLLAAVPAQSLRSVLQAVRASAVPAAVPLLICAKGLEIDTGRLLTEVAAEALPGHPAAVLSGPNFAGEIARRLPAATAIAARDPALGAALVATFGRPWFRPYPSEDPVGVQVGGAFKNVLAIASGAVTGRALGENAQAALLTRGIAEMARLAMALGGAAETCMGLSGLGDALLTCTSETSRNTRLGIAIGRGMKPAEALAGGAAVVEGYHTARAVHALSAARDLDLPVAAAVHAVLYRGADLDAAIAALLARPYGPERPTGP
ncbi:MAG: NAD(P)H-dependent glycerol-3-phosphate dehydrogenase [Sneathiellaceae bacterium]